MSDPCDLLAIDADSEIRRICDWIMTTVARTLGRRGVVVAMSGGVDSSVCAALAVRPLGRDKVSGLLPPEGDSNSSSPSLGGELARTLGIQHESHDISSALSALGCYARRDEAIRRLFPEYREDWKCKIVIAGGHRGGINFFKLVVQNPAGEQDERRLPLREYLEIVAATNYKQRVRKTIEYFHADRLNYAVVGTPNRLEFDQGFFVKNGDGPADLKPIAHLYKSQVYDLARHLGLPESICRSEPTTDTYSLAQGQDEFYFALDYRSMDLALKFHGCGLPAGELASALSVTPEQAARIYADIESKRRSTRYLHRSAILLEPVFAADDAA